MIVTNNYFFFPFVRVMGLDLSPVVPKYIFADFIVGRSV